LAIVLLGLFIFGLAIYNELFHIRYKRKFIEMFTKIRDEEIEEILPPVKAFL